MPVPDYYELLQISTSAEPETIHRVYRFLAARFHPDNAETGDSSLFFLLKQAYDVLSNPERRAKYDASFQEEVPTPDPLSTSIDFMDQIDGELNRRLAVLAVLYVRRRTNPANPDVSLQEVELKMGFPRDYLEFTTWYLQKKGYITRADNSAFTLTAEGVDFVEAQRANIPVLGKLLTSSSGSSAPVKPDSSSEPDSPHKPVDKSASTEPREERRANEADWRRNPTERRSK
jgi:curved DNA-binding protein CbpA